MPCILSVSSLPRIDCELDWREGHAIVPCHAHSDPVRGGPPVMLRLFDIDDTRGNDYSAGLADLVHIVRADFLNSCPTHLTFQRRLHVAIPGISTHGGMTQQKTD